MSDIEKLFKEKLAHHSVAPPPDVWDKLQAAQQQEDSQKKGAWWWVAASVAMLLTLGGIFLLNDRSTEPGEQVAIETSTIPEVTEPSAPEAPTSSVESFQDQSTPSEVAALESNDESKKSLNQVSVESTSDDEPVNKVDRPDPIAKIEAGPLVEENSWKPANYSLPQETISTEAIALAQEAPTVTIIYKSGKSKEVKSTETKRPFGKAATFLANIKENGVGFSELRAAKSEIISKAFSNRREAMPAE